MVDMHEHKGSVCATLENGKLSPALKHQGASTLLP